jgi:MFS family permease
VLSLSVREPSRRETLDLQASISFRPVWTLLSQNRRAYFALILGPVLNLTCIYAQLAWFPTVFIRLHGWTPAEIGGALGLIGLPFGTLSAFSGGWFMSWLARRGHADAPLLAALCHALSLAIFGTAAVLVASPGVALACYVAMAFPTNWTYAAALTGINQITPNEMRGQVVALYTLAVGLIAVGVGTFAVGLLNDIVYGGGKGVAPSLATVYAVCGVLAAVVLVTGRRPFRAAVANARAWAERP